MLGITDEYAAFCFDEACYYIMAQTEGKDGKKPRWSDEKNEKEDLISFLKKWK